MPNQTKQGNCGNMPKTEKSREEVVAEREAKKAAKLAARKAKSSNAVNTTAKQAQDTPPKKQNTGKNDKQAKASIDSTNKNKNPNSSLVVAKQEEKNVVVNKSIPEKQVAENVEEKINTPETKQGVGDGAALVGDSVPKKSKAELRAERRAKQEAQRAAKATQQQEVKPKQEKLSVPPPQKSQNELEKTGQVVSKQSVKAQVIIKTKALEHRVKLFNHLYHEKRHATITEMVIHCGPDIHEDVWNLGVKYADRTVIGSNARCIAFLEVLKHVIKDYKTPPEKEFCRGIEAEFQVSMDFLNSCRPAAVSMTNALRHLTRQLTQLPNNIPDSDAKKKLLDAIDTYIREQIDMAAQAICIMVQRKIANGDVILIYGCSSLLLQILLQAHSSGTKFRVIVVDGCPMKEGHEMLRRLLVHGVQCSYVLVTAASFVMREVTKVFLGAHALLANGYVMSRVGSSQVALLAHSYNVPVLVCCETHKFCERVQTDSFVCNELGNPDDLIPTDSRSRDQPLLKWRNIGTLTPLNLTYDVTPPDLVTAVVTELAILPCTSVPVILRIKPSEIAC